MEEDDDLIDDQIKQPCWIGEFFRSRVEWIRGWVGLLHPLGWATPARRLRLGLDHTAVDRAQPGQPSPSFEPSPVSPHRVD